MRKTLDKMTNYNFDSRYTADENGNVYFAEVSKYHPHISVGDAVKAFTNKYGYIEYILRDRNGDARHIQAHRITASLFVPMVKDKLYVNHIDGDKFNNHMSNLEWCTASENEQHSTGTLGKTAWNKGLNLPSGKLYTGKIRPVQCLELDGVTVVKEYFNPTEAEQDGYKLKQISAVCCGNQKTHKGKIWKYIEISTGT